MSRPQAGEVAERLYAELAPYTSEDEASDWHLLRFADAICEVLFERIHLLVSGREDVPGWASLLDPDLCPAELLPHLAQYAGVVLEPNLTEQQQRDKIRLPENFRRGGPGAMRQAIERTLTGNRVILIAERQGSAYGLWVRTYASETPSSAATEAAAISQKPAGIVLTYEAVSGQSWGDLISDRADWDAVGGAYPAWSDAVIDLP